MKARDFLEQYKEANRRVRRLELEYEEERLMVDSIRSTSDIDGMPHGRNVSKTVEDRAIRLVDKLQELADARLEAVEVRQRVFDVVDQVEGLEGEVLYERYIKLHKWEEVCVLVRVSWTTAHEYHKRGLAIVDEIISNKYE